MLFLFRRKPKANSAESVSETSKNLKPPPYQSSNSSTFTIEKKETFDPHLDTGCLCHARYHVLKSAIEEIFANYLALPTEVQKKSYTIWASGRIGALVGIVRTPSSPCTKECKCHDEYMILKKRLESDEKDTEYIRKSTKDRKAEEECCFERWIAEVHFLHGMMRMCPGQAEKATNR